MAGISQVTQGGPKTFTAAELVRGGQVVEARASGRIGVAAEDSEKVLGVALTDAQSPETVNAPTTDALGRPIINTMAVPSTVAVAYSGTEVKVTYSAAAEFGDVLVSTGDGEVGPADEDATVAAIVGRCTQPGGVAAAGVGLIRLA